MARGSLRRVKAACSSTDPPLTAGHWYEVLREFNYGGQRFFRLRAVTGDAITAAAGLFDP